MIANIAANTRLGGNYSALALVSNYNMCLRQLFDMKLHPLLFASAVLIKISVSDLT